jgi:hypothetical protein
MSKTKEAKKRIPLSSTTAIGARSVTITVLSPDIGENHLVNYPSGNGLIFDSSEKAKDIPWEVSGVFAPAVFRVEGFLDNGSPTSFLLTLDKNDEGIEVAGARSVRVQKIEAEGKSGYLSASLLKDIALDAVREECLRLVAVRVRLFPEGVWSLHNFGHPLSPEEIASGNYAFSKVGKGKIEIGEVLWGARAKDARHWAQIQAGKRVRTFDAPETLKAVARLHAECPPVKNKALWIRDRLEEEGFVSSRGVPFETSTVNTMKREARKSGHIKPSKNQTKKGKK